MASYLLDSNIYLNFYERYYKQNIFPTFWTSLEPIINRNVIIPKVIIDENYQDPWFKEWIDNNYSSTLLNHKSYVPEWSQILAHIQSCGKYRPAALSSDRGWGNERIADAWIIAIAKKDNLTIVTEEKKNPNLSGINPSKSAKIPDVCQDLGVRCITMNQFFGEVGLVI